MRKWDEKSSSALAAWVHKLRGRRATTGNSSRINAAPVFSGQVLRQNRRAGVAFDPLKDSSSSYQQVTHTYCDHNHPGGGKG